MSNYKGDCRAGFSATAAGYEARLRVVNDTSAMSDRTAFEFDGGASVVFYYKRITTTNLPNKVTISVYYETGTGTLIRTFLSAGAEPADGTSYTFFGTSDGTSGGAARAGIARFRLIVVKDNSAGNLTDYNVNSDSSPAATFGTGLVLPVAIADAGCLRSNCLINALTVNAYPAGSKFANNETVTLGAAHTQKYAATGVETCRLDVIDASDVQKIAGSTVAIDAGTSYTQNFTVNSSFTLSNQVYGSRFLPIGNSAFVPTSGAIPWAKFVAAAQNTLTINDVTVSESAGTMTFTVTRGNVVSGTTTVNWGTSDGLVAVPAVAGDDYTTASGTVTFTGVQTSQNIVVTVLGNSYPDPNRNMNVTLSGAVNGNINDNLGVGTITDDEAAKTYLDDFS